MSAPNLSMWLSFVSQYPNIAKFFAYDFPRKGTWRQYREWVERIYSGVRGDPTNPAWTDFLRTPIILSPRSRIPKLVLSRLRNLVKWAVKASPDKVLRKPKFDVYYFPDDYVYVLPHSDYGWGMYLAFTDGIDYILVQRQNEIRVPYAIRISPAQLLADNISPLWVSRPQEPPLFIDGAPKSREFQPRVDFIRTRAFFIRPFGVEPNGFFVVGHKSSEQVMPVGKIGQHVFLSPQKVGLFRVLLRLADLSYHLCREFVGDCPVGGHREYNVYARVDYALTLFHTLLLADFPAYRASLVFWYSTLKEKPRLPLPASFLVIKQTCAREKVADIYDSLPEYVGFTWFPTEEYDISKFF